MSLSKVLLQKAKERQREANYSSVYNIAAHGRMEPYWTTPITVTFNLQLKR